MPRRNGESEEKGFGCLSSSLGLLTRSNTLCCQSHHPSALRIWRRWLRLNPGYGWVLRRHASCSRQGSSDPPQTTAASGSAQCTIIGQRSPQVRQTSWSARGPLLSRVCAIILGARPLCGWCVSTLERWQGRGWQGRGCRRELCRLTFRTAPCFLRNPSLDPKWNVGETWLWVTKSFWPRLRRWMVDIFSSLLGGRSPSGSTE